MHPFVHLFFLIHCFLLATAAPKAATNSTSLSHNSTSTASPTHTSHKAPLSTPHANPDPHPLHSIIPDVPPFTPSHTRSRSPNPAGPTGNHFRGSQGQSQSGQKPISIAFEVLGGLFAGALLLGFIRCFYNYKKTPGRDRIADIVQRHQLQRELEELERNPALLRRHQSVREPAPPYFPRPPSYENPSSMPPVSLARRDSHPQPDDRAQYSAVATYSPPPTPPMSERILLPMAAATPRSHPELPSS